MNVHSKNNTLKIAILPNSDFDDFYRIGNYVENILKLPISEKINDFDTLYWTIDYNGHRIVLTYNTTFGVYAFCNEGPDANNYNEKALLDVSKKILDFVNRPDGDNISSCP